MFVIATSYVAATSQMHVGVLTYTLTFYIILPIRKPSIELTEVFSLFKIVGFYGCNIMSFYFVRVGLGAWYTDDFHRISMLFCDVIRGINVLEVLDAPNATICVSQKGKRIKHDLVSVCVLCEGYMCRSFGICSMLQAVSVYKFDKIRFFVILDLTCSKNIVVN